MNYLSHLAMAMMIPLMAAGTVRAQTSTVHVVEQNGERGKRLNIVFLSEGYTSAQMGSFATDVQNTVNYLFTREPWVRYRSYCNVFRIEVASNQSGTDNGLAGGARDTYFGTGFNTPGITQLLTISSAGSSKVYALLNTHVPEYTIPIVIVNDQKYGGSGGAIAVASVNSYSIQITEHEVGHSFAKLTDEYDDAYPGYPATEFPNATAQTQRSLIRWNAWINAATAVPTAESPTWEYTDTVGLFEGANYRSVGWYRPHDNALMRSLAKPPGFVAREAFILNYYSKVSPVDGYAPLNLAQTVTQRMPLTFSVTPKIPSSGPPLTVTWKKDGGAVPIGTGTSLNLPSQDLGNGTHTLTAVVTDPTDWVRRDPTALMSETITWKLTLSNQGLPPTVNQGPASALKEVGQNVTFSVDATPAGAGALSYQWYKDGKAISKAAASTYSLNGVKLTDGGVYTVRITGDGAFTEIAADLVVINPQVQKVVLAAGKTATLSAAIGGPVQAYEWLREDVAIPINTSGYSGLGSGKLIVAPLNVLNHQGRYSLRLTTSAGVATYDTHLLEIFDHVPELLTASGSVLAAGRVGAPYSQAISINTAIPGRSASTYGATGLPPGLKVDVKTGVISGIPTAFKADAKGALVPYLVTLTAGNGLGSSKATGVKLLVTPLPVGSVGAFVSPLDRNGPQSPTDPHLNDGLGGRLDLTTTGSGSYTGKVTFGAASFSFKGMLTSETDSETVYSLTTVPRPTRPPLEALTLDFDITNGMINGMISSSTDTLSFSGWGNPFGKSAAPGTKGYYTFRLEPKPPATDAPAAPGFGSFTIGADGKTTIAGRTADGETFSSASHVGAEGQLMIYSLQAGKPQGSILGAFRVNGSHAIVAEEPDNLTYWRRKSTDTKARVYKDGFAPVTLHIVGGGYQEPVAPLVVLNISPNPGNATLTFTGASLAGASQTPGTLLNIGAKSVTKPIATLAAGTTLTFTPKLGTFTGKYTLVDDNPRGILPLRVTRAVTYQGVIVNDGGTLTGDGYFLLPDLPSAAKSDTPATSPIQSGAVKITHP